MGQGKKLQKLLKKRDITVAELSRNTGISANTLYAIIKRDSNINIAQTNKIGKALNISMEKLNDLLNEPFMVAEDIAPYYVDNEGAGESESIKEEIEKFNEIYFHFKRAVKRLADMQDQVRLAAYQKNVLESELDYVRQQIESLNTGIENMQNEIGRLKARLAEMGGSQEGDIKE